MASTEQLPIYLINLARSTQRLADADQQLARLGCQYQRIDAVDGAQLSASEVANAYDADTNQQRFYVPLAKGEIACYMSHQKAWRTLLESSGDAAIVLEDDIVLSDDFAHLGDTIKQLPSGFDLIKLAQPFKPKESNKLMRIGRFDWVDYRTDKPPMGACGYIISRQGARKLLDRGRFFRPVDVDMQWQWETGCYVTGLLPYCVDNTHAHGSDILSVDDRHQYPKSKWLRLKEQWRFYWQNRHFNQTLD